jgi:M-phase inducer tyrosine phosphatase
MKKSGPDYFNVKPIPSPTASLAADLSQNFHIDQRFVVNARRFEGHQQRRG